MAAICNSTLRSHDALGKAVEMVLSSSWVELQHHDMTIELFSFIFLPFFASMNFAVRFPLLAASCSDACSRGRWNQGVPARLMNLVSSAHAHTQRCGIGGSYQFPRVVHHFPGPDCVDRMGYFYSLVNCRQATSVCRMKEWWHYTSDAHGMISIYCYDKLIWAEVSRCEL